MILPFTVAVKMMGIIHDYDCIQAQLCTWQHPHLLGPFRKAKLLNTITRITQIQKMVALVSKSVEFYKSYSKFVL